MLEPKPEEDIEPSRELAPGFPADFVRTYPREFVLVSQTISSLLADEQRNEEQAHTVEQALDDAMLAAVRNDKDLATELATLLLNSGAQNAVLHRVAYLIFILAGQYDARAEDLWARHVDEYEHATSEAIVLLERELSTDRENLDPNRPLGGLDRLALQAFYESLVEPLA